MKYIYFGFLLLFISFNAAADVFTEVDTNGATVFSDKPLSDKARKMSNTELNQSSTIESAPAATQPSPGDNSVTKKIIKKPYTTFVMSSPVDQETIQNQPVISVDIKIDPALQPGDKIQIYLDGMPWGAPLANTHFDFPEPDRGTHTLSANLIDRNNITLNQTRSITVFIHQAHIPTSPRIPTNPT